MGTAQSLVDVVCSRCRVREDPSGLDRPEVTTCWRCRQRSKQDEYPVDSILGHRQWTQRLNWRHDSDRPDAKEVGWCSGCG